MHSSTKKMQHIGESNRWIYILFVPVFIEPNKIRTREEREKEKDIAPATVGSDSCRISIRRPIIFKRKNEVIAARRDRRRGRNVCR